MYHVFPIIFVLLTTNLLLNSIGTDVNDEELKVFQSLLDATPPSPISQQECEEYCKEILCLSHSVSAAEATSTDVFDERMRKTLRCFEAHKVCSCRTGTNKPAREESRDCHKYCNKDCSIHIYDPEAAHDCRLANRDCVCWRPTTPRFQNPDQDLSRDSENDQTSRKCKGRGCSTSSSFYWTIGILVGISLVLMIVCAVPRGGFGSRFSRGGNVSTANNTEFQRCDAFVPSALSSPPDVQESQLPYTPNYISPSQLDPRPGTHLLLLPSSPDPSAPVFDGVREDDLPPPYESIVNPSRK